MSESIIVNCGSLVYKPGDSICGWRVLANDLGSGSSGEVYRVANEIPRSGLKVGCVGAMKIFVERQDWSASKSISAYARFKREIEVLKDLNQQELKLPFFSKFYDDGEIDGHPFYVMEELSKFELPNTDKGVADFMRDLCKAVEILHKKRYVHRDIKPDNILRRGDGSYVLIDLGLVKRITANGLPTQHSLSIVDGRVVGVGTQGYAAPEQLNEMKAIPASDIYALGEVIKACFSKTQLPEQWKDIVIRATTDADVRFSSVEELRKAIKKRGEFISDEQRESKEYKSTRRWLMLKKVQIVLGIVAAIIAILGIKGLLQWVK